MSIISLLTNNTLSYQWYQNGQKINNAISPTYIVKQSGNYTAEVFNEFEKHYVKSSINILVNNVKPTNILVNTNLFLSLGESISLKADEQGISYTWIPTNTLNYSNQQEVLASPIETTIYKLLIRDLYTCYVATKTVTVMQNLHELSIPEYQMRSSSKIYTPNGDGYNDIFEIEAIKLYPYLTLKLVIVDVLGNIVYQSNHYDNSWIFDYNGKLLPQGTYYYSVYIEGKNEKTGYIRGFFTIPQGKRIKINLKTNII